MTNHTIGAALNLILNKPQLTHDGQPTMDEGDVHAYCHVVAPSVDAGEVWRRLVNETDESATNRIAIDRAIEWARDGDDE